MQFYLDAGMGIATSHNNAQCNAHVVCNKSIGGIEYDGDLLKAVM